MFKKVLVILSLLAFCYCMENNELLEDGRAKKKKSPARLWGECFTVLIRF